MSPVPRSFHILTSFSHESDSHRNNFARLPQRRSRAIRSRPACSLGSRDETVQAAAARRAAHILKTDSSSSSPDAVFTSSSCTSGLNSTCAWVQGRSEEGADQTRHV